MIQEMTNSEISMNTTESTNANIFKVYFSLILIEYILSRQKLNWNNARESCQQQNGALASIGNANENSRILGLINSSNDDYWIGLNDIEMEGTFKWSSSNSIPRFKYWAKDEPSDNIGKENCVEMRKTFKFMWNDLTCNSKKRFICEKGAYSNIFEITFKPIHS